MASSPRSKLKGRRPSRPPKARVRSGSGPERPAPMHKSHAAAAVVPTPAALVHELGSCVTEADIAQVLYRGLHPLFGYDVVNLHVLEREGWYHSLSMDSGVLQDLRRRPLSGSVFVSSTRARSSAASSTRVIAAAACLRLRPLSSMRCTGVSESCSRTHTSMS